MSGTNKELACRNKLSIIYRLVERPTKGKEENGKQRSPTKVCKQELGANPPKQWKDKKTKTRMKKTLLKPNVELLVEKKYCPVWNSTEQGGKSYIHVSLLNLKEKCARFSDRTTVTLEAGEGGGAYSQAFKATWET